MVAAAEHDGDNYSLYSELNGESYHVYDGDGKDLYVESRIIGGQLDEVVITARKTSLVIHQVEWRQLSGEPD